VEGSARAEFGRADANADGKISRDEARGNVTLNSRFRKLDRNGDGSLSPDEFKAARSDPGKSGPQS
jgi:hypothetical protein